LVNLASKLPYKHIIEENIEGMGRRGRRRKQLLDDHKDKEKLLEPERGSIRSPCMENSLWKGQKPSRKTDYEMKEEEEIIK
jgi:hypothetical protein